MTKKFLNSKLFFCFFLMSFCVNSVVIYAGVTASYKGKGVSEDSIYDIDPDHSSVTFRIRHLVSVVKGQFKLFKGQIYFDPKFKDSAVEVVIDPTSIDTNQEKRDEHLRGPEFFDVDKFSEIRFKSRRMTPQIVIGDLTLCGVTKEVTLDYIYHGTMNDVNGRTRIGFSATGVINRSSFGIMYNKNLTPDIKLLGDEVPIEIEVQAVLRKEPSFQNKPKTADKIKEQ